MHKKENRTSSLTLGHNQAYREIFFTVTFRSQDPIGCNFVLAAESCIFCNLHVQAHLWNRTTVAETYNKWSIEICYEFSLIWYYISFPVFIIICKLYLGYLCIYKKRVKKIS